MLAAGEDSFFKSVTYELNYKGMLGLDSIEEEYEILQNPAAMVTVLPQNILPELCANAPYDQDHDRQQSIDYNKKVTPVPDTTSEVIMTEH